jgi:membrane fusion protein (multidrug efflux system)
LRAVIRHPILIVAVLVIAGLAAATVNRVLENKQQASRMGYGGGASLVVVQPARMEIIVEQVEAIGTALANESVNLTAKVTDTVSKVNFEDGNEVEQGTILVELTNTEETARLAEAQATLAESARQVKRLQNLIDQGLASELQLDEEQVRQQTAKARLDAILARLDDRLVRAPFKGVLGFRNVSQGTLLTSNTIVTTLDDVSVIKLDFSVPEIYLSVLHAGQEVDARSSAYPDTVFRGKVNSIGSRVDPVTRAVFIRAHIQNQDNLLRPGMLLTVALIRNRETVMVIPEEALIPIQDKQFVFMVDEENRANRVEVEIGRRRPGIVEILGGLNLGDNVVTEGVMRLRPGSMVKFKEDSERQQQQFARKVPDGRTG